MHEKAPHTTETAAAFERAEGALYDIIEQDEFALACEQQGLDAVKSVSDPAYWEIVEGFAYDRIRQGQKDGEHDLDLAALQITTSAPLFLYAQQLLASHTFGDRSQQRALKERVSHYNSLIRYVGGNYQDAKASVLSQAMLGAAEIAEMATSETDIQVHDTIRGAQHELVYGQLLTAAGIKHREASLDEDLHGIDYVVEVRNKVMFVDVKASLSQVEALGASNGPLAIKRAKNRYDQDTVVMFSLARDSELGDNFFLPEETAAERAPKLVQFLEQASKLSRAA